MKRIIKSVLINWTMKTKIIILDVCVVSVSYPIYLTMKIITNLSTKLRKTIV